MIKIRHFLFSKQFIALVEKKQHIYRSYELSSVSIILLLAAEGLWQLFFRSESVAWQSILEHHALYFPNKAFKKTSIANLLRYPIQALWLCIVKPYTPNKPRIRKCLRYIKIMQNGVANYIKPSKQRFRKSFTNLTQPLALKLSCVINQPVIFIILLIISTFIILLGISRYFSIEEQFIFFIVFWLVALGLKNKLGQFPTIALTLMSVIASCRYLWWRYSTTLIWFDLQSQIFGILLICAETYVAYVLLLGYFQSAWSLNRQPVALPKNPEEWPSIDVMIATYNESLDIVKLGVYAALGLDWPKDKLNIYLLDDGNRSEFKQFAQEVSVHYIARETHEHAKAGNINHALTKTEGEFIVFFDCDFITTRAFLQLTMGWFLKDKKMAFIQTPHHFFSQDPFEKNLNTSHKVPNESHLFYDIVQNSNDTWNATYFCGSSGIFRRTAMESIGGMATESITEDALTSLRLHQLGHTSGYLRIPLAAGLATDSISVHIGQRIRWARGMVQILRIERPITNSKLKLPQRLCYFNAILHFLSGLPRLIFLTIPFAFLVLNANIFYASPLMVFLYLGPHLLHAMLANSKIQGEHRHFMWNELYETIMSYYITRPALSALFNPKHGSFNVTSKGGLIKEKFADWKVATPYLVILTINVIAFLTGLVKLLFVPTESAMTIVLNLFWVCYNLAILGGVMGVIIEERQIRAFPRVSCDIDAIIKCQDGHLYPCRLTDYSARGMNIKTASTLNLTQLLNVEIILQRDDEAYAFACIVRRHQLNSLSVELMPMSHSEFVNYIQCTFARADTWAKYRKIFAKQRPMRSIIEILKLSRTGYYELMNFAPPKIRRPIKIIVTSLAFIQSFLPCMPQNTSANV